MALLLLSEIENLFAALTFTLLGLDQTNPANFGKVRKSWQVDGAPAYKKTDNIVFFRVSTVNDPYSKQRDTLYTPNSATQVNAITSYTLPHVVSWTARGPNSSDNMEIIRNGLFVAHDTLAASNLYLVPDVLVPVRLPELFNGQWWERTDFSATFYESVSIQATVPTIASATVGFTGAQITIEEG